MTKKCRKCIVIRPKAISAFFKRGMKGVYQHCAKQHLHRYLVEYVFRYNNREALGCNHSDRSVAALQGIIGKRLRYVTSD